MPITTPSILSLIWTEAHGVTFFLGTDAICAEPGLLITAGTSGSAMGLTSVVFDDDTGEPLAFQSTTAVTAAGTMDMIGAWHYPLESCVVVFGVKNDSTAADVRVYGRRIYYDSGGNFTADPLATWSPGLANAQYCVGRSSSDSAHALGVLNTGIKTVDFNLSAGSVGSTSTPTVNAVFGGSLDRTQLGLALKGDHAEAAMCLTAYQNSAGIGTAQTYIMEYLSGTPTASLVSASRMTAHGSSILEGTRSYVDSISGLGGSSWRLMDTGGTFTDVSPPTDVYMFTQAQRSPQLGTGYLDSHNNENRDYLASATNLRRRVRMWDPDTSTELYAWQYGTVAASLFPSTGRLVERGEFWFNRTGANFEVWGGDFPDLQTRRRWWVGVAGWGG